jgi:hypothetical protein
MRFTVLGIVLATLIVPGIATPSAQAPCSVKLSAALKQNRLLRQRVKTLTIQRDDARMKLTAAQSGTAGLVSTLRPDQVWALFQDPISHIFTTPRWSTSYFSSGSDYASWTFTRCDFCQ